MTGCMLLLTLVVVFSTQQIMTVSAVYTMNETCAFYGNGFIANPNSCAEYGFCENGVLLGTDSCPTGLVYNFELGQCDFPENVDCSVVDPKSSCLYADDKTFVVNPTDCSSYCYCENKVANCSFCPKYQEYDPKTNTCVWPDIQRTARCMADSVCRFVPNGKNVADPNNCGQFVTCYKGLSISSTPNGGKCPISNMYFNAKTGDCEYENPCENTNQDGVETPMSSNSNICQFTGATASSPVFVADNKTCMGYFICESESGPGNWDKCPLGLHFNGEKCVTPYSYACKNDRCGNIMQEFVAAIDSECHNYLICKNQTSLYSVGDYRGTPCGNNLYFDEYYQECTSKNPSTNVNYKLC